MFKKGDRVLCVVGESFYLEIGNIYTVREYSYINSDKIILEENDKYNWFETRFILATPLIEALF